MSTTVDSSAWSSSRLVPSIIFVLTPCIAVSLLVCWSLRMQFARRRWYTEMTRRNRQGRQQGTPVELGDQPPIHEVWLGRTWEDIKPNKTPKYDTQENKKAESRPHLQGYVMEQYSWQTILPVTLSNATRGEGLCELGVLVRMPSKTPYTEISHTSLTNAELDIATLTLKPPSTTS